MPQVASTVQFPRYRQAVDYLQRYLWHELPIIPVERALQTRVLRLLDHFGNPHLKVPVVHVGGSAGKGSTATIAAGLLEATGVRTGLYTSPHLQTFVERIRVDGRFIPPDEFSSTVLGLDSLIRQMHLDVLDGKGFGRPALVEVAFATGMKHFADERCEAAVIEVGLGGRTDCTNVFGQAEATIITNVEFEHRDRLGPDIASIARQKAAIIKGGTVVTGARRRDALSVIQRRCDEQGATLLRLGKEIRVLAREQDGHGVLFDLRTPSASYRGLRLGLAGRHQAQNAALALAAVLATRWGPHIAADEDMVRRALGCVRVSGRLETMQRDPEVLLDGAHNPVEARALAQALRARRRRRDSRLIVVAGILGDKERGPMVRALATVADRVIVTRAPLEERAGDPQEVVRMFQSELSPRTVAFEDEPRRALDVALSHARPQDIVCVTGSMFLVGALRERWVPEERILRTRSAAP